MPLLVRVEKDWDYPDIWSQTPNLDGRWGDLVITTDPVRQCDLLIVLNAPKRDIHVRVPAGNKWLWSQESPVPQYAVHRESFAYFDRIFTFWDGPFPERIVHDQTSLQWHVGRNYSELSALPRPGPGDKRDGVSWVTSNASHKPGHELRLGFLEFLRREGFPFDLYGRGFMPIENKFDAIHPYKYSIAIENYFCDDYWTEKLADCFLSWTVPIYAGATNVLSYFPAESMILIDPADRAGAIAKIRRAIDDDHFGRHIDAIGEARRLVLEKYQFYPHIASLVKTYAAPASSPHRPVFIPINPGHYASWPRLGRAKRHVKAMLGRASLYVP